MMSPATLRREFPEKKEWGVTVTLAREAIVGKTIGVLRAMVGAVALLLSSRAPTSPVSF